MKKMIHKSLLRFILGIVSLLLLIWSLLPAVRNKIINEGVMATVVVSAIMIAVCIFGDKLFSRIQKCWKYKVGRILLSAISFTAVFLFTLFLFVSCRMLYAAGQKPEKQATVIVLGAAIYGDRPSSMLADRLDAAVRYLNQNNQSVCIVSGGQGTDEQMPEADVMYTYLTEKGIDSSRIYKEDKSKNTEENIRFSKVIMDSNHLETRVVISTQEFHQFRAQSLAKHNGLSDVSPCTCRTKFYLLECYWVREFAAICRFWLLGY